MSVAVLPRSSLPDQWRGEAALARSIGAEGPAMALEKCASDLEGQEREAGLRLVTLHEAADLSGYTYSALEKKLRRGDIPNAGEKHRPRLRVADLPLKAGPRRRVEPGPELADRVLALRR